MVQRIWAQGEERYRTGAKKSTFIKSPLAVEARRVLWRVWPPSSPVTPRPSARTRFRTRFDSSSPQEVTPRRSWRATASRGDPRGGADAMAREAITAALDENKTGAAAQAKVLCSRRIRHLERESQAQGRPLPRLRRCSCSKKSPLDLGGRGRRHDGDERALIVSLLDEATEAGLAKNEPRGDRHRAADGAALAQGGRWEKTSDRGRRRSPGTPFPRRRELESWRRRMALSTAT
jgi:hypothetical protein